MGVDIQRDACIGVPHHILPCLDIHPRICHVGAEGMPEHMRRDVRQRSIRVQLAILFHRPPHLVLDVQCHLRVIVFIQQQKPTVAINDDLIFQPFAVCKQVLQALEHILRHRDKPAATLRLGFLDVVFAAALPDQLMIHTDPAGSDRRIR